MKGTTWRLLRLVAPGWGWLALAALLGFATVGSSIGLMATAAYIIASAALHPSIADLAVPIVGVRFFGIARGVCRYLERYVSHNTTFRLLARLRVWFYASLEPLAPARLQPYRSGDLLARTVADVEALQHFYIRVIAPPAVALLVGLAVFVFTYQFDASLAYTLAGFLLLAGIGLPYLARRLSLGAGRQATAARAELNVQLVDGIQGLAELAAYGQEHAQMARVRALDRRLAEAQAKTARVGALHTALGGLLANLGTFAVLVAAIPLVSGARLDGVYLPVLALAALASFEAVAPLPLAWQYLESSLAAAGRLFALVDAPPEGAGPHPNPLPEGEGRTDLSPGPSPLGPCPRDQGPTRGGETDVPTTDPDCRVPPSPAGKGVRGLGPSLLRGLGPSRAGGSGSPFLQVRDLRFRYGPGERWALDGVSFAVAAGQKVAIVGPSGAGKSTLVNLLLRFWDYEEGHITLGGRELRAGDAEEVRHSIALVSQRTYLFNATIRQNLLLAHPRATEEEMMQAARQAQLHEFVRTLPRGYDTWVGEQGLRLSGGERQRLAIARALLKDAPILVLDEALANLDPFTEQALLGALRLLAAGRTTLFITHRLVGLEDAAEILVLRGGRVVERGRQEELLAADGLFRRMWEQQRQLLPEE